MCVYNIGIKFIKYVLPAAILADRNWWWCKDIFNVCFLVELLSSGVCLLAFQNYSQQIQVSLIVKHNLYFIFGPILCLVEDDGLHYTSFLKVIKKYAENWGKWSCSIWIFCTIISLHHCFFHLLSDFIHHGLIIDLPCIIEERVVLYWLKFEIKFSFCEVNWSCTCIEYSDFLPHLSFCNHWWWILAGYIS